MKKYLMIAAVLTLAGCTDATKAQYGAIGTPGHILCFSGGEKILDIMSTGVVINHSHSNGYYFKGQDGQYYDVQADCVIIHP